MDTNADGSINLTDLILILRLLGGINIETSHFRCDMLSTAKPDINGDGRIGPEEAVHILQAVAGLR